MFKLKRTINFKCFYAVWNKSFCSWTNPERNFQCRWKLNYKGRKLLDKNRKSLLIKIMSCKNNSFWSLAPSRFSMFGFPAKTFHVYRILWLLKFSSRKLSHPKTLFKHCLGSEKYLRSRCHRICLFAHHPIVISNLNEGKITKMLIEDIKRGLNKIEFSHWRWILKQLLALL